jgi:imidazolonepropionase-like amidohydrolase
VFSVSRPDNSGTRLIEKQSVLGQRTYLKEPPGEETMRTLPSVTILVLLTGTFLVSLGRGNVSAAGGETLALLGAKIYLSPTDAPILNGVVLVQDGKITTVGKAGSVRVPADAKKLDCAGLFITAGFQNSHVHFTEQKWDDAANQPASKLSQQLAAMLTRYGFTTVVDAASTLTNTVALRSRIQSGDVPGPRILTAGLPLYATTPFYLKDTLPPAILEYTEKALTPTEPEGAAAVVKQDIAGGADIIKLFTGSLASPTKSVPMNARVVAAAVAEAHAHGKLVFAHPSDLAGLEVALDGGVDVAAHTTPMSGKWDDSLVAKMKEHHMSLIPTLKLWIYETGRSGATAEEAQAFADAGVAELGQYERAGGQVLFGTDVGYMTDYDPTEEYVLMARAGLTPMQILDSLTTVPAARFGESKSRGRVAPGMDADLAVLSADPTQDARNFVLVRYTIRSGRVIYPIPTD